MRARTLVFILFVVAACLTAFGENNQAILPYDSPLIGWLRSVYLEAGKVPLTTVSPYSVDEILLMLEKINPAELSDAGKRAYEEISAALPSFSPRQPVDLGLAWHPSAALEGYFHTNPDPTQTEWEYDYNDRQPLISIPVEVWAGDGFYGAVDLSLKLVHDTLDGNLVPANYTNFPTDFSFIDVGLPFRAFVSAGGPHWAFTLGRDRFAWGSGFTGNLAISDAPDYYDFARLTGYWRDIKYTAMWITLLSNLDPYRFAVWGTAGGNTLTYDDYPRSFFTHRLDVCLFDRVSLSATEGVLIGGVQPDLVYFNPLIIFHDLFRFHHAAALLAVEVSVNPWRFVELYGQAAFNQIQSPFELERYGPSASATPDANAFLAGARGRIPVWEGYIDVGAEYVYTSPWMYIRENVLTCFQWWRYEASNVTGSPQWISAPLGYYEGPDAMVFSVWAGYDVPNTFAVSLDYKRALKGQQTLATPYAEGDAAVALTTPSGTAETKNVFHLRGTWDVLPFLKLGADLYGITVENFHNVSGAVMNDFQAAVSVKVHF